jgi:AbrB family looped-hinge helix DNA binding protein
LLCDFLPFFLTDISSLTGQGSCAKLSYKSEISENGDMLMKSQKAKEAGAAPRCRIEALVSIDAKGQILLPKEIRKRAGLRSGDKLAVIICESGDRISRITLVKADEFAETAREMLGPMLGALR